MLSTPVVRIIRISVACVLWPCVCVYAWLFGFCSLGFLGVFLLYFVFYFKVLVVSILLLFFRLLVWFFGVLCVVCWGVLCVVDCRFGAPVVAVFVRRLLPFLCAVCCRFCAWFVGGFVRVFFVWLLGVLCVVCWGFCA